MKVKAMAPFEITDRKDVTAIGEPSYTSAVHKWNGTMDNLNANAVKRNTNARICKGLPVSYTHLRAHETVLDLVCRLLLEKKKKNTKHTQP